MEESIAVATSSLSAVQSLARQCESTLPFRLESSLLTSTLLITDALDPAIAAVQQCVPAFVCNARRRARAVDKDLELAWEEFDGAGKILKAFLQQIEGSDGTLECTKGSLDALNRLLDSVIAFPAVSVAFTPSHSRAVQCVSESSHLVIGVDSVCSQVTHARWLARGEGNLVTITLVDSAGEAVCGVTLDDVRISVCEECLGWSVASASVEISKVEIEVVLTAECSETAALNVDIAGTAFCIALEVSHSLTFCAFFVQCV